MGPGEVGRNERFVGEGVVDVVQTRGPGCDCAGQW